MPRLYRLFFRNFMGPWVITLCIALFILVLKTMELWLADLAESGSISIIAQVAFWTSLMVLPGALSIASMAAATMTIGGFKERNELSSLYAVGVSPARFSLPVLVTAISLFGLSVFATQYITPKAYRNLVSAVWEAKAGDGNIAIKSGRFLQSIENVTMYIADDEPESDLLKDIVIYDRRNLENGLPIVLVARHGSMTIKDKQVKLYLFDGNRHEPDEGEVYSRTHFDSLKVSFEVPEIEAIPKVPIHRYFMSNQELHNWADSLERKRNGLVKKYDLDEHASIQLDQQCARVVYEVKRRWAMPMNTVAFFLIGWIMGLRIGKGGLAVSGLIALGFTIVGALLLEQGKRLAHDLVLSPFMGAWLPVFGVSIVAVISLVLYHVFGKRGMTFW